MRQNSGIGVLDKAVAVLYAAAESPCGLAELCERTGLPRATAHRLAAGLETHRLLCRDVGDSGRFMTLLGMEVRPRSGVARYVRAGHDPVILYDPDAGQILNAMYLGLGAGLAAPFVGAFLRRQGRKE